MRSWPHLVPTGVWLSVPEDARGATGDERHDRYSSWSTVGATLVGDKGACARLGHILGREVPDVCQFVGGRKGLDRGEDPVCHGRDAAPTRADHAPAGRRAQHPIPVAPKQPQVRDRPAGVVFEESVGLPFRSRAGGGRIGVLNCGFAKSGGGWLTAGCAGHW